MADTSNLAAALSKAQGSFLPVVKNRTVTVRTDSGSYRFSYATYDACLRATKEALASNGLAFRFEMDVERIDGVLSHESGEEVRSSLPIANPLAPVMDIDKEGQERKRRPSWQTFGSGLTYARRYLYCAMLNLSAEEDDDGIHADGNRIVDKQDAPEPPLDQLWMALDDQHIENQRDWCEEVLGVNIPNPETLTEIQLATLLNVARGKEQAKRRPKATASQLSELNRALDALELVQPSSGATVQEALAAKKAAKLAWIEKHARKVSESRQLFSDEIAPLMDTARHDYAARKGEPNAPTTK